MTIAPNREPKMLVLDLDGTTVRRDHTLNPRDVEAVKRLQDHGVHVTIATGRLGPGAQLVARPLGITGDLAAMNGSEIIDAQSGEVRSSFSLGDAGPMIRQTLSSFGAVPFGFGSRHVHYGHSGERFLPYLRVWTDRVRRHEDLFAARFWHDDSLLAVGAVGRQSVLDEAGKLLAETLPDNVEVLRFPALGIREHFLKIRDRREDKGTAIVRLAEARGLTSDNVVAVGDWLNDLPMLKRAGVSFAMGQAHQAVKDASTDVLQATSETGGAVAEVAQRVWGITI